MTSTRRSRRHVTVAALLTAAAGLALWPAPQSFAALPPNVVAFDPQPDPPGCLLKVGLIDKDTRGYGVPDTFELLPARHECPAVVTGVLLDRDAGAIIIHYNQPVDPDALAGKR